MRNEEVVGIYQDTEAAFAAGMERYGRGEFSYQEIGKGIQCIVSTHSTSARQRDRADCRDPAGADS